VHIAIIHGAFARCEDEANVRRIWTLYILDRWLSALMGRPPTIADDAIRLPLPSDMPSLPPSAGLRAHVELSKISGYIVCEVYKIAPRENIQHNATHCIDKALKKLESWQMRLPPFLQQNNRSDPSTSLDRSSTISRDPQDSQCRRMPVHPNMYQSSTLEHVSLAMDH